MKKIFKPYYLPCSELYNTRQFQKSYQSLQYLHPGLDKLEQNRGQERQYWSNTVFTLLPFENFDFS